MSLIEIYNNTDNTHRQGMFYEYLKKSGLKESSCRQYAMTHPNNEAILTVVNDVAKKNSLFEVVDLLHVNNIYNKVKETDANKSVNNALSTTIYNYKKFLDYLETGTLETNTNVDEGIEDRKEQFKVFCMIDLAESTANNYSVRLITNPVIMYSLSEVSDKENLYQITSLETIQEILDKTILYNVEMRDNGIRINDLSGKDIKDAPSIVRKYYDFTKHTQNSNLPESDSSSAEQISPSIWVYSPGEGARKWKECQEEKLMLLGWDGMDNFRDYETRQDIVERLREVYGNTENAYTNDSLAIWQFSREMRPGDIVYVKRGVTLIVGRGVVKGDYTYNPERYEYKNSRAIEWTNVGEWEYPKKLPMKTLTRINDYTEMVERLEKLFDPEVTVEQIPFSMSSLISAIKRTGLLYEDKLIQRYACSLMTKPFVILSGLAGSGKTQLALAFARAMSENVDQQLCVVPVGADWTNREPLLGYPNALKQGEYMQPESGALQIMMRAQRNPQKPYFLVLDEMNLSYVERYFADFLSALESNQKIPLWEKPDECDSEVDASIALPKNLFIVGTINVDETTYMFSPKVLDRANVIEFKISDTEMEQFLSQDMNIDVHAADGDCANMGQDFVLKATNKATDNSELAQQTLLEFFKVLKKVNAEFGYRSATEIYRFIANAKACVAGMTEDEILDAAIVQKLLPKLHGSRKKLEPALKALWGLCMTDDHKTEAITRENAEQYAKFKEAADKIQRMMQTALDNGFTSFAEA